MGACTRNMKSDSAEIKPAQCCIKLVFHLTYQNYQLDITLKQLIQSLKPILILSFHPNLRLQIGIMLSTFLIKILRVIFISHTHCTFPTYLFIFIFLQFKSLKNFLCAVPSSRVGLWRKSAASRLLRFWVGIPPGYMDMCLL